MQLTSLASQTKLISPSKILQSSPDLDCIGIDYASTLLHHRRERKRDDEGQLRWIAATSLQWRASLDAGQPFLLVRSSPVALATHAFGICAHVVISLHER
jgi:hypothetical protein